MIKVWPRQSKSNRTRARCLSGTLVLGVVSSGVVACGSAADESCETVPGTEWVACGSSTPLPPIDPQTQPAAYINVAPVPLSATSQPYVTGKMVIVDKTETGDGQQLNPGGFNSSVAWQIEQDGQGAILAEIAENGLNSKRAHVTHPDEVGTVVWMSCVETPTDTYSNGATGYTTDCTASVIDKAKNIIVSEKTLSFPPPGAVNCSQSESTCGPFYGRMDYEPFAQYLEGLPRTPNTLPPGQTAPAASPQPTQPAASD